MSLSEKDRQSSGEPSRTNDLRPRPTASSQNRDQYTPRNIIMQDNPSYFSPDSPFFSYFEQQQRQRTQGLDLYQRRQQHQYMDPRNYARQQNMQPQRGNPRAQSFPQPRPQPGVRPQQAHYNHTSVQRQGFQQASLYSIPQGGQGPSPQYLQPNQYPVQGVQQFAYSDMPPMQPHSNMPPMQSHSIMPPMQSHLNMPPMQSHSNMSPMQSRSNMPPMQSHSIMPPMQSHSNMPPMQSHSNMPPMQSHSNMPSMQSNTYAQPGQATRSRNYSQQSQHSEATYHQQRHTAPVTAETARKIQAIHVKYDELVRKYNALEAEKSNLLVVRLMEQEQGYKRCATYLMELNQQIFENKLKQNGVTSEMYAEAYQQELQKLQVEETQKAHSQRGEYGGGRGRGGRGGRGGLAH